MEKKFSMDEVNNFLANLKKKRGKKTNTTSKTTVQEKPIQKKEDNNKNVDNIFEIDNTNNENNIASKIFDNNTNNSHQDTQVENLFKNENEKKEETIIDNKPNMIEQKPIKKEIPKQTNDNINNINLNEKYNNFDNGIVLNNPLLNEEDKAEDIFEGENNINNNINDNKINNKNDIFESEENDDAEKIFGSGGNNDNDNNKNIFEAPKKPNVNNNKMAPFNNNINYHKNIQRVQPKPPKINNKFNSPFGAQNQKTTKQNINNNNFKQNNINEQFINNNENNDLFNNKNDDDVNNIFNNQNDNNKTDFEEKFDYNFNDKNISIKDNQQNLNNEVEKLDDEQTTQTFTSFIDSSKNLYHNNNLRNFKNQNNINENLNMNIDNSKRNYDSSNYIEDKNDEHKMNNNVNDTNSHFKFDSGLNNDQNVNSESYSFSSIDQDYVLLSSNDGQNILINNIYLLLNSYSENQLYDYYFPVSYSNKEIDFNKLSSMLSIILNNGNELNEPISHIAIYILKYIIEKRVNVNQINILNNNDLKNKIIEILSNNIRNENKGIISLNNLFNTEILFNSLNNSNNSVYNYSITNDALTHPLDYVINLFNEKILNKNNILYIYMLLLNLKENEHSQSIGFEEYDFIFENFNIVLYILLKYFNDDIPKIKNVCNLLLNSYSPKLNFCHFILLKCILGDYDIQDEKYYGRIFISFLQFPTIEKLLVADIYNFILYTMSSQYKKVIAKSSILIKYKYSLVKQNYKKDQRLVVLGQKIYENISQFGLISKNNYFKNYIKTSFYNNKNGINADNNIKETTYDNNVTNINNNNNNNNINNNNINNYNKNNINIDERNDKKVKKETVSQVENNDNGGLFSTLKYAFGFGGSESNNDNNRDGNGQHILTEEEKKRLSPEELWRIEHPGEPEIVYDPKLKRYILRGKIYDDQEEVIQKKEKERPMVPPPKMKKTLPQNNPPPSSYSNNNDNNYFNGQESNNNEGNVIQNNNISNPSSNKINNPFAAAQFKKQPKPPQLNQKQRMNNLHNRYAVGYNK